MRYDTVICGAGLAGLTAALVSLSQGKKTAVIAQGESSLYYTSAYLDLLGNMDNPWPALDNLIQSNPGHPYALVGAEEIGAALAFFVSQIQDDYPYELPSNQRNSLVPTCTGSMRYTYLLPGDLGAEKIADPKLRALAIGFEDYRDYSAQLMVTGLNSRGCKWRALEIESGCPRKNQNSIDLAAYFDDAYPDLLEKLSNVRKDYECLVFPAVLGLKRHRTIMEQLNKSFGVPVFEVPTLIPSVPGIRLSKALSLKVRKLGGDMFVGFPIKEAVLSGSRCQGVVVASPGRPRTIEGETFILATGGIVGEGIAVEPGRMREVVFGLPVVSSLARNERFLAKGQGYAKSGIRVNNDLQPVESDQKVILDNVFCAGRMLAGYDPFTEYDGAGVAIVTGFKAAHTAIGR